MPSNLLSPTAKITARQTKQNMTSTEAPISQQEIIGTYRQMQSEMQGMIQQLTKIEMERNEHA